VGQAAGHPAAFLVVILYAVLWLAFSPATFEWNAVATLAVSAMTLFIQRANRRDMRRKSDIAHYYCLKFPHLDQAFTGTNAAFLAYFAVICG
jgi:hypothetical protein